MTTIHQAAVARTQTAVSALDAASLKQSSACSPFELDDDGRAVEGPLAGVGKRVDSVKVETVYLPMASKDAMEVKPIEYGPRSLSTAAPWAKDFLQKNGL